MTTETTQPVVDETKTTAEPVAAVDSARNEGDDLETLLATFDKETAKPVADSPPANQAAPKTETVTPDPLLSTISNRLFKEDLNKAVKSIVGDSKVPQRFALGWLDQVARENPKIANAFTAHFQGDSSQWDKLEPMLAKQFAKELKSFAATDQDATEDRVAVAAAVRGASTKAPTEPAPNFAKMDTPEYRKTIREQFGFDPGV